MTPEQLREYETWDADSRMAFDELAADLEYSGMQRADAELHAFALTRQTAQKMTRTPHVNRQASPTR